MADENIHTTLSTLAEQIARVDERLSNHIKQEEGETQEIFKVLNEIRDTISQAKGAQRMLIWLAGIVMGGAALANSWFGKQP